MLSPPLGSCCEPPRRSSSHPCTKKYIRRPFGTTDIFGGQGWSARDCHGSSLFLDYLQSLGGEHSFSTLISITVNASLVIVSAWLLLRTTAAVLISPLHIKIYPPSLWDNGYIWWAGVDSDHRSQVTTDLQSVPFGRSGTYPYMELAIRIEPTTC